MNSKTKSPFLRTVAAGAAVLAMAGCATERQARLDAAPAPVLLTTAPAAGVALGAGPATVTPATPVILATAPAAPAAAVVVTPAPAAVVATAPAAQPRVPVAAADLSFASAAAGHGIYEAQVGELALQRAQHPEVREFGRMMVNDHRKANSELVTLMREKGVVLPTTMQPAMQAKLTQLSTLSGEAFDRAFIRMVGLQDHSVDIAMFEQASRSVADAELRAWATRSLPVLRKHHRSAERIAAVMEG